MLGQRQVAKFHIDVDRFASILMGDPVSDHLANERFTLARDGKLSVQWAPFNYTPSSAGLIIVGITPGREQALNGFNAFADALRAGVPIHDALRNAKLVGSFSGTTMRKNLVQMLDSIGAQKALRIATCADLFDAAHERVHFTSALRYPVFVDGANYNGSPDFLQTRVLRDMIETCLMAEARTLCNALWLPLGPKPTSALRHLVSMGALSAERVLEGMPHPSGANAERIKFFLGLKPKSALSLKTRPGLIEQARERLIAQVAELAP
jgi:hypothetical protein